MDGTATLYELLSDGWRDAVSDPPDTDRLVQVAWDDGSTNEKSLAFYDGKAGDSRHEKFWWGYPSIMPLAEASVLAWRERQEICTCCFNLRPIVNRYDGLKMYLCKECSDRMSKIEVRAAT